MERKELIKKVIEAGLVPKHTLLLMQRWRLIDIDESTKVPTKEEVEALTAEQLEAFVKDIGEILEAKTDMPELMETDMELERLFREKSDTIIVELLIGQQKVTVSGILAVKMRDGSMVLRRAGAERYIEHLARPGSHIISGDDRYEVMSVEVRYMRDAPEFYSCKVRKVNDGKA